ncbi:MAG: 50S ribosomal protein L17 [Acidobacteriota bacterium]|nr:50S ribosomal protein L17 [Blastocatellia bacterium]MDW8412654.1 50S ribosomal protein L17 [Acidobacteriota bacterium]
MRHRVAHRKLGRTTPHRKSLLRNLATSLILNERIVTTVPKAKELRPFVEKAITLGKEGTLHARRLAAGYFHAGNVGRMRALQRKQKPPAAQAGVAALAKLFEEIAKRYEQRPGGYTRIVKLGHRRGDGAEMALIELVDSKPEPLASASK